MEIKELVIDAHNNSLKKGFHELEYAVIQKMKRYEFTNEEIESVINAFKSQGLMLIVGELAEAQEAIRKNDNLNFKEEIADVAIRLGDFSGNYGISLEKEIINKMIYNKLRPYKHGKQF